MEDSRSRVMVSVVVPKKLTTLALNGVNTTSRNSIPEFSNDHFEVPPSDVVTYPSIVISLSELTIDTGGIYNFVQQVSSTRTVTKVESVLPSRFDLTVSKIRYEDPVTPPTVVLNKATLLELYTVNISPQPTCKRVTSETVHVQSKVNDSETIASLGVISPS